MCYTLDYNSITHYEGKKDNLLKLTDLEKFKPAGHNAFLEKIEESKKGFKLNFSSLYKRLKLIRQDQGFHDAI